MGEAAKPKMQSDFLNSDVENLEEIKKKHKKKSVILSVLSLFESNNNSVISNVCGLERLPAHVAPLVNFIW